jgi:hypothetical protein
VGAEATDGCKFVRGLRAENAAGRRLVAVFSTARRRSKILSFLAVLRFNEVGSRHSEIGNVDAGTMKEVRKMQKK